MGGVCDKPQERMLRSGTQRGWQECVSWETAALVPVHLVQPNRAQAIGTIATFAILSRAHAPAFLSPSACAPPPVVAS